MAVQLSDLDGLPDPQFHERAQRLLDQLPLSHVQLLSPQQARQEQARRAGAVPEPLRMASRRGPGWLYLRLPSFSIPAFTLAQFRDVTEQIRADDALVLDMRLNAGGSLSCAGEVLGALLGGDIPYARTDLGDACAGDATPHVVRPFPESANHDHGADVAAVRSGPTLWLTPTRPLRSLTNRLVVVIGSRCHSAGEIVAAALAENNRGTLVGEQTAGAVVAADEYPLGDGWVITLPFANLRTANGVSLEGVGATPDIPMTFTSPDTTSMTDGEIARTIAP